MPSSLWLKNRYTPFANTNCRDQRTEKLSAGTPAAGNPVAQAKSIMRSLRVSTGVPDRSLLLQYSPFQSG